MSTEERNKSIIRQIYTELFTQGKLSLAEELFAADFIDQEAPVGQPNRGPEAIRQLVTMFHTAFPDVSFHVEEVIAEGETVAARVFWTGTHRGNFLGIAPTGRTVRQKQMHFMHLRDGQLVEHLAVRDDLGLRQQLGVLAAPTEKKS
jgi:steroid delta-isomerase-like uncharacterized protein